MRLQLAVGSLALILVGCAEQLQVPPLSEYWRLSAVLDGKTILVQKDNQSRQVRLACIDVAEKNQPMARDYLRSLLPKNSEMGMTFVAKDQAEIFIPKHGEEETFIQYEMTRAGLAYISQDKQNCPNFDVMQKGEDQAKTEKLGVWSR